MTYLGYVVAAYALFGLMLAWDWLAPRLQLHAALRALRRRAVRATAAPAPTGDLER